MTQLYPVAILAGGLATRIRPLTEQTPKALLPINGEPFIAHQLRLLKKQGIERVVLCLGYLGEMIVEYLGSGSAFGLDLHYVFDGPKLLGTAGALKNALNLLGDNFFVLYGDSYLRCDFLSVQTAFNKQQISALMTVYHNRGFWDTSNIELRDGCIIAYDKHNLNNRMHHIDYGLGVFNKAAFAALKEQEYSDLAELYQNLLMQNQLAAYEVYERFYEVGSFAGIEALTQYLLKEEVS